MSKPRHLRKQRRRLLPLLLLAVFVFAAVYAGAHCLFRQPEQKLAPAPARETSAGAEAVSSEAQDQEVLRSHLERKADFYTILVSGVDDGNGGSDTNILLAVDAVNNYIYGVSIPRDTKAVWGGKSHKINAAYNTGGMEMLADVVSQQLGIPVDYTVLVDLRGFEALVNAIGGVDFTIPVDMDYDDPVQDLHIHFTKGYAHLNGADALKVVRFRHNNDGTGYGTEDIGRIGTQQAFLKAVAKQLLQIGNVKNIPALVDIFYTYVKTDLTTGNLVWLGNEALNIGTENIHFATLPGDGSGYYNKQSVYVLDAQATCDLVNEALNPYNEALTLEDMDILVP